MSPNKRDHKRKILSALLVIAILVSTPLFAATLLTSNVNAAALTEVSDTLEDARPSTSANHTIQFVATSGVAAAGVIELTIDPAGQAFNLTGIDFNDLDLDTDTTCSGFTSSHALAASPSGATWGVSVNTGTDVITITSATDTITAGHCVRIRIGDNAVTGATGVPMVNPAATGSYSIDIEAGSAPDTGSAMVAIVDAVVVTATIDTTLTFTVDQGTSCTNLPGNEATTSATTIPYGTVNSGTFYNGCLDLEIATNAADGYTVYVAESDQLTSGSNTIADGDCDGGGSPCNTTTDTPWATASNDGFGYCMEGAGVVAALSGNYCSDVTPHFRTFGSIADSSPAAVAIMNETSLTAGTIGKIQARLSVSGAQPAGTYTNQLTFIAAPQY